LSKSKSFRLGTNCNYKKTDARKSRAIYCSDTIALARATADL